MKFGWCLHTPANICACCTPLSRPNSARPPSLNEHRFTHGVSSRNAHTNGRDGAAAQWRAQFTTHADVNYVRTTITVRVFTPWQMAEETGAWVGRWTDTHGRVVIRGTYTAKWRRIDGAWLLEAEVFTPRSCKGSTYCDMVPPQPK